MARTHQADTAASTSDLELVKGIGPKVAAVLHDAGINSLTELVARTPEELATKLVEHHVRVPAEKIVTDDWLGQARSLLHDSVAADTATSASAETATAIDHPWHELAGFSVFVEPDALGRTQTRLTDYETSGSTPLPDTPRISGCHGSWSACRNRSPRMSRRSPRVEVENSVVPIRDSRGALAGIEVSVRFRHAASALGRTRRRAVPGGGPPRRR